MPSGIQSRITFEGRVVDADTNEGLNGAVVIINGYKAETKSTNEASAGWFRLDVDISAGTSEIPITVSIHGYQTHVEKWRLPQPLPSYHKLGNIELLRRQDTATLVGRVVDRDTGKGIRNAMVCTLSPISPICGWTAIDGWFMLSGIPAGDVRIKIEHPNFITLYLSVILLADEQKDIGSVGALPLGYPIAVSGVVLNVEDQSPVKGATVNIAGKIGVTNEEGRFELHNVPSGEQLIKVSHHDYEQFEMKVMIRGDELTLYLVPRGALPGLPYNISGVVRLSDGQPANGATVELIDVQSNSVVGRTITDAKGWYAFFVPAGEYIVRAQLSGYRAQERRITLPYGGVVLSGVNFELQPL